MPAQSKSVKQRLRITYSVDGPIRYGSHLDRMRIWERVSRRASLPMAYSEGFHPRPRMQAAAALPVGFSSQAEMLDIWLRSPIDLRTAREDLGRTLPEGMSILQIEMADPAEPPLSTQIRAAEYAAAVETSESLVEVTRRIDELLASESLPRQRRGRAYDLRPLIHRLEAKGGPEGPIRLEMVLSAQEGATGRPEEVLDALGLADGFFTIRRERMIFGQMA